MVWKPAGEPDSLAIGHCRAGLGAHGGLLVTAYHFALLLDPSRLHQGIDMKGSRYGINIICRSPPPPLPHVDSLINPTQYPRVDQIYSDPLKRARYHSLDLIHTHYWNSGCCPAAVFFLGLSRPLTALDLWNQERQGKDTKHLCMPRVPA
jgi:hypothetical protein